MSAHSHEGKSGGQISKVGRVYVFIFNVFYYLLIIFYYFYYFFYYLLIIFLLSFIISLLFFFIEKLTFYFQAQSSDARGANVTLQDEDAFQRWLADGINLMRMEKFAGSKDRSKVIRQAKVEWARMSELDKDKYRVGSFF
jgi:hypothetical protein